MKRDCENICRLVILVLEKEAAKLLFRTSAFPSFYMKSQLALVSLFTLEVGLFSFLSAPGGVLHGSRDLQFNRIFRDARESMEINSTTGGLHLYCVGCFSFCCFGFFLQCYHYHTLHSAPTVSPIAIGEFSE